MSDPAVDAARPIEVRLGFGHTESGELDVRVSPEAADEMRSDLEAEGIFTGNILEFSAAQQLAILGASILGGGGGLAAALTAFLHRNRHKAVSFRRGDIEVQVSGHSEEASKRLIANAVEEMISLQRKRDAEWKRVLGREDEDLEH